MRSHRTAVIATQTLIALAGNAAVTLVGRAVHLNPNTAGFAFLIVVLLAWREKFIEDNAHVQALRERR